MTIQPRPHVSSRASGLASGLLGLCVLLGACSDDHHDSDDSHASHTTTEGTTHVHTSGEATTHVHTSGEATTHASGETHDSDSDSDGSSSSDASSSGGYAPPSAADYCECMLDHCHDLYHSTWGEDHHESEEMCIASADGSPSAGEPVMSGNFIECRMHFCQQAADTMDESVCADAIGGGACS